MKKHLPALAILLIMILSAILHLWRIDTVGNSNAYYTAAVEAMTQSWHNFFYAAAEPGGSVTVDKPPLGLQIETLFALVLGVSGFSTVLPNILAGVFSVPLLYHLVKKHFGVAAGLVAALVMASTPVVFVADRNNTQDGLLTFVLLLAAWAFIKAVETGRARWLFLGAFIVGLGFNIKMLQAYLPVPAFFAFYFLGSRTGWLKKTGLTLAALVVMAVVSLSWALYVDSVPTGERPFIGSSQDNTVMGLITGHNGTSRLFGGLRPDGQGPQAGPVFNGPDGFNPYASPDNPPLDNPPVRPDAQNLPPLNPGPGSPDAQPPNNNNGQPKSAFSSETGSPGILRFFQEPLSAEMSWLLPFALISLFVLAFQARPRLPLESGAHLGLILWGGWLLTCAIFLSLISGIFHAYYVVMLVPALGAVVGGGFGSLWKNRAEGNKSSGWILLLGAAVTVGFQVYAAKQYEVGETWVLLASLPLILATILLAIDLFRSSKMLQREAFSLMLAGMLLIPLVWSALTVKDGTDNMLPVAYGVRRNERMPLNNAGPAREATDKFIGFLEANTQGIKYLAAVPSSGIGAGLVLVTGRPVLYMGGFGGNDHVVDAGDLAELVAKGELRYVLFTREWDRPGILHWLKTTCTRVEQFIPQDPGSGRRDPNQDALGLYDCR